MRQLAILLLMGILFPFGISAQRLADMMSKYHGQECVTVTLLDKSLYGLYKKTNLPAEVEEMIQKLDEVNFLNLNMTICGPEMAAKVVSQFKSVLDNPSRYKLIKSHSDGFNNQFIYTQTKNGKVLDLVVWNQNRVRLDIIELKGDIQLDKVSLLSKALNIKGLNTLAALSSEPDAYDSYRRSNGYIDIEEFAREREARMKAFAEQSKMFQKAIGDQVDFGEMMSKMFESLGRNIPDFTDMEKFFIQGWTNDSALMNSANTISNAVSITNENGKTKIKVDSKNSNIVYVIDGREVESDQLKMPEQIRNISIEQSKKDGMKKSYLLIMSGDKAGEFVSYQEGVLTFKYEGQKYEYNLAKFADPLLVVNGHFVRDFSADPSTIYQIRPVSKAEKDTPRYGHAEVIINTR